MFGERQAIQMRMKQIATEREALQNEVGQLMRRLHELDSEISYNDAVDEVFSRLSETLKQAKSSTPISSVESVAEEIEAELEETQEEVEDEEEELKTEAVEIPEGEKFKYVAGYIIQIMKESMEKSGEDVVPLKYIEERLKRDYDLRWANFSTTMQKILEIEPRIVREKRGFYSLKPYEPKGKRKILKAVFNK